MRNEFPVFTIFAVPKPFSGQIGIIQQNAIRSWTQLDADQEIILFGAEEGIADAADRLEVRHEPKIRCNEYGTPLVSDVFERAQIVATHGWLCYANCDVILMSDLSAAVRRIATVERPLLVSGRRWKIEMGSPLEFDQGWEDRLRRKVKTTVRRDSVQCMDYFLFKRGLFPELPEFALGRGRWDSYLPHRARALGALWVDATSSIMVVHQNHDFAHPKGKAGLRNSPEGVRNGELARGMKSTLGDASHKLTRRGLRRALDHVRLRWWLWANRDRPYVGYPVRTLFKHDRRVKKLLVR